MPPGGCLLAAAYLHTGEEDSYRNMLLMFELGAALRAARKPYIIGAGWQMEPATLQATGWIASVGGRICRAGRPTCYIARAAREID